jgi:hypothetical protein
LQIGCDDDTCASPSFASSLSVPLTATSTYYIRVHTWDSATPDGTFYLTVTPPTPPPANDECGSAIALAEGENGPYDNAFATDSAGFSTPAGCGVGGSVGFKDVFFTYTAPCNGNVDIQTCDPPAFTGTNDDTQIVVHPMSDCPTPVGGAEIACNDDFCGAIGFQSFVNFPMTAGTSYLIRVASWGATAGTFKVTVTRHTAAFSTVGLGCSDGGGAGPSLTIDAPPVLGSTRTFTIASAEPSSPGVFLFSPPAGAPTPLGGGCSLYLAQGNLFLLTFITTDAIGGWSLVAMVPGAPFLECLPVWVQGIIMPAPASWPPFYQVTDGLELILGV